MPHRGPKCHVTPHEETFAGSRGGPTQPTLVGSRGRNAAGAKPGPLSVLSQLLAQPMRVTRIIMQ